MAFIENPTEVLEEVKTLFDEAELPYVLLNGMAMHLHAKQLGLDRQATDVDIAVMDHSIEHARSQIEKALACLHPEEYKSSRRLPIIPVKTEPVHVYGMEYRWPQVKMILRGAAIDVLSRSVILHHKQEWAALFVNFSDSEFRRGIVQIDGFPVASLEWLRFVKAFQSRGAPKQDLSDMDLIDRFIEMGKPFDWAYAHRIRQRFSNSTLGRSFTGDERLFTEVKYLLEHVPDSEREALWRYIHPSSAADSVMFD